MYTARIQAGEKAAPALSYSPSMLNIQGTKQVHARLRERRFVGHHTAGW